MSRKIYLSLFLWLFILVGAARADILYLKNGRNIEGIIKSEDNESVELEVESGSVTFRKEEIENITRSTPEQHELLRKLWEKQRSETGKRILMQKLEEERQPKKVEFFRDRETIALNAVLNKRVEARLILDTGATLVILRKKMAQELGIDPESAVPDVLLTLADGRQISAKRIILASLKVENTEAENVEAALMLEEVGEGGFGDGLLGMSYLKNFNFKVNYVDKELILEKISE